MNYSGFRGYIDDGAVGVTDLQLIVVCVHMCCGPTDHSICCILGSLNFEVGYFHHCVYRYQNGNSRNSGRGRAIMQFKIDVVQPRGKALPVDETKCGVRPMYPGCGAACAHKNTSMGDVSSLPTPLLVCQQAQCYQLSTCVCGRYSGCFQRMRARCSTSEVL